MTTNDAHAKTNDAIPMVTSLQDAINDAAESHDRLRREMARAIMVGKSVALEIVRPTPTAFVGAAMIAKGIAMVLNSAADAVLCVTRAMPYIAARIGEEQDDIGAFTVEDLDSAGDAIGKSTAAN